MRLLLVDDQALFLAGLRHLLTAYGLEVVGTASDGLEALTKTRVLHPDVILMDIQMPGHDGLKAVRRIKAEMPETKIVMLTVSGADEDLLEAIQSGASGYLLKSLDDKELCELLSRLAKGEPPLSREVTARILEGYVRFAGGTAPRQVEDEHDGSTLSPRQKEILGLVAQGRTYKEIADLLCVSRNTVKYHMVEVLGRLGLRNRAEAIAYAERAGLTAQVDRRARLPLAS